MNDLEYAALELRAAELALSAARARRETAQDLGQERAAQADADYWERQVTRRRAWLDQLRRGEAVV